MKTSSYFPTFHFNKTADVEIPLFAESEVQVLAEHRYNLLDAISGIGGAYTTFFKIFFIPVKFFVYPTIVSIAVVNYLYKKL